MKNTAGNGILSSILKSHDLIKLSKSINILLTKNERIFCGQAYQTILVESKYPVPLTSEGIDYSPSIGGNCSDAFICF